VSCYLPGSHPNLVLYLARLNGYPLYDRNSTSGLAEDVHVLASVWFDHDAHESVEEFVCHWPLSYVDFDTHDRYAGHTRYEMEQLFRAFLIKALHGWAH
jgi:hypothetical protein